MSASVNPFEVVQITVEEEMKRSYLDYAMSVIVSRALPDVRDGLKPVHRRILYAMMDLGFEHNKPFRKSARVLGEVLGKYHTLQALIVLLLLPITSDSLQFLPQAKPASSGSDEPAERPKIYE